MLLFNLGGLVEHLRLVQASEFLYGMPLGLVSAVNFTLSTLLQQRKEITCELISQGVSAMASASTLTEAQGCW